MISAVIDHPVFVSYVRQDKPLVDRLVKHLRDAAIDVRFDDHLQPGQVWKAEIEQIITGLAGAFILCLSSDLEMRLPVETYVTRELEHAAAAARFQTGRVWFIPVQLNTCDVGTIAKAVSAVPLADYHIARLDVDWAEGMQRLVASIRSTLGLQTPAPQHPLETVGHRGTMTPCRFQVRELFERNWRWRKRADVEVLIVEDGKTPERASLIPSGRAPKDVRHSKVLDPERKQKLTGEFLRRHAGGELKGFRFKNDSASLPQVYCTEYDEYLIFST